MCWGEAKWQQWQATKGFCWNRNLKPCKKHLQDYQGKMVGRLEAFPWCASIFLTLKWAESPGLSLCFSGMLYGLLLSPVSLVSRSLQHTSTCCLLTGGPLSSLPPGWYNSSYHPWNCFACWFILSLYCTVSSMRAGTLFILFTMVHSLPGTGLVHSRGLIDVA